MAIVIQEGAPGLAHHGAWRWTLWLDWRKGRMGPTQQVLEQKDSVILSRVIWWLLVSLKRWGKWD